MSAGKTIGLVLLAVGVVLLFFGWQSTQSLGDQIAEAFTGRFTEETMLYLIAGVAGTVAGVFLLIRKGR
ncbi:MAG: DUF3185 family protein [Oleiphilaceae bacterium]|nr:DUF3185 family protein [Oleiphilaceae bacterium]